MTDMSVVEKEQTAQSGLLLESLEIQNFRAFRYLQIERLGRVNLIVGKNNVGKTCLLEALWLYARRGDPEVIWKTLETREEIGHLVTLETSEEERASAIKYLFYGRPEIQEPHHSIRIGAMNADDTALEIGIGWYTRQVEEGGGLQLTLLQFEEVDLADNPTLRLRIQIGKKVDISVPIPDDRVIRGKTRMVADAMRCVFTSAYGMSRVEIGRLWDNIALSNLEGDVVAALCIIDPNVERISIIGDQERRVQTGRMLGRIPILKLLGRDSAIPIRNLGEGMNRMLGIALALVNAKDGFLLVDEIESGLHYSVQPDMWRMIFQVARRLNVQVFATTHSWDCIEAFQKAACEDQEEDGMLISLRRKQQSPEDIVAILFDERRLAIATQEQIEVR